MLVTVLRVRDGAHSWSSNESEHKVLAQQKTCVSRLSSGQRELSKLNNNPLDRRKQLEPKILRSDSLGSISDSLCSPRPHNQSEESSRNVAPRNYRLAGSQPNDRAFYEQKL